MLEKSSLHVATCLCKGELLLLAHSPTSYTKTTVPMHSFDVAYDYFLSLPDSIEVGKDKMKLKMMMGECWRWNTGCEMPRRKLRPTEIKFPVFLDPTEGNNRKWICNMGSGFVMTGHRS